MRGGRRHLQRRLADDEDKLREGEVAGRVKRRVAAGISGRDIGAALQQQSGRGLRRRERFEVGVS